MFISKIRLILALGIELEKPIQKRLATNLLESRAKRALIGLELIKKSSYLILSIIKRSLCLFLRHFDALYIGEGFLIKRVLYLHKRFFQCNFSNKSCLKSN